MIIMSRHRGETISLFTKKGQIVNVSVVDIRGDKVRLSIDSDPPGDLSDVRIHRGEIQEIIDRDKKSKSPENSVE